MKAVFTVFLIVSFIGIAVFGVFAMSHDSGHAQGCIAAAAQGTDCPKNMNTLPFLSFHFGAFKSFSTAVFYNLTGILLFLFAIVLSGFIVRIRSVSPPILTDRRLKQLLALPSFSPGRKLVRWLALHENSPAFS